MNNLYQPLGQQQQTHQQREFFNFILENKFHPDFVYPRFVDTYRVIRIINETFVFESYYTRMLRELEAEMGETRH